MQEVGLMPSHTGAPGGNRTGQQMADYPIEDGVFLEAFGRMSDSLLLPFKAHSQRAKSLELMELIRAAEAEGKDTILLDGEEVSIAGIQVVGKPKKRSKLKYTCLKCQANVWGKPGVLVACAGCMGGYKSVLPTHVLVAFVHLHSCINKGV